jgi:hypothetical protein
MSDLRTIQLKCLKIYKLCKFNSKLYKNHDKNNYQLCKGFS